MENIYIQITTNSSLHNTNVTKVNSKARNLLEKKRDIS